MDLTNTLIALAGILIGLAGLGIGYWAGKLTAKQGNIAERDLTLSAYANAVQGILDLKRNFAENPDIFQHQVQLNTEIQKYIPEYMREDIPAFLAFAGGMWRLSYVYSVMQRGKTLGLTDDECIGLKNEMLLWLQHIPGFYDVYRFHTSVVGAHNPAFLKFLAEEVYNEEFLRQRGIVQSPVSTNTIEEQITQAQQV